MNIIHAAVLILLAGPAFAQSAAQQQALKLDADLIRTMTDAVFLSLTGRAVADEAPVAPDATASAEGPDSRLSRPRALSMIYETLDPTNTPGPKRTGVPSLKRRGRSCPLAGRL